MQRAAAENALRDSLMVLSGFKEAPAVLIHLVRSHEYAALKDCVSSIVRGEVPGTFPDLGRFSSVNTKSFPKLGAMVKNTVHDWIPAKPVPGDLVSIESGLDTRYYTDLLDLSGKEHGRAGRCIHAMARDEVILRNCAWALRMRFNFNWDAAASRAYLIGVDKGLAGEALAVFSLSANERHAWKSWAFEPFFGDSQETSWRPDAVEFERRAAFHLYKRTLIGFRLHPLSIVPLYCLIKLKDFEVDLLTMVMEALRLGMEEKEIRSFLEGAA